ncbi:hypothetical protein EX30DRAFT_339537 [Ascodesmis nigricans]|uniref:F-box domain-containing protein n=1 Tax=Ascodesmis nigricans TaxID=341454 RepID=A0A4V3SJB3_9PEZI|nr:hypothetical protein EX30DRAFT_339537 [Ascodesmis nigricans]
MASLTTLPTELVSAVFSSLVNSHDCPACAQADLHALTLVSRSLRPIATEHLYSSITLRPHDSTTYEPRLTALKDTLSSSPALAAFVHRLRFSHEQTAITRAHWSSVVALAPNLKVLQGVDTFFPEAHGEEEADTGVPGDGTLDGNVGALMALPHLTQAVLHHESLPVSPSQLLSSWPSLQTLVIGNIHESYDYDDVDCTLGDLSTGLAACKNLRNIYFHDCDLDSYTPEERQQGVWPSLPPLERLGIEYSLAPSFSLPSITSWLSSSRRFAETLHTLDFHRQLRSAGGLRELADLLAVAKNLRKLSVSLTWTQRDMPDTTGIILRSSTLDEMRYIVSYMPPTIPVGAEEEFETVLSKSIHALPRLKMVTVGSSGGAEGKWERLREMKEIVVVVEEMEEIDGGVKRAAGLKRSGKGVRCEVGENAEPVVERAEEEVQGEGEEREEREQEEEGGDLVEMLWDEVGELVELWCA